MDDEMEMDWMTEDGADLDVDLTMDNLSEDHFDSLDDFGGGIEEYRSISLGERVSRSLSNALEDPSKRRTLLIIGGVAFALLILFIVIVGALLFSFLRSSSEEETVVSTSCGDIVGTPSDEHDDVVSFLGIRFAKAPVGPLRWKAADALDPWCYWNDTLYANVSGPACMQFVDTPINVEQSEDCLRLNIHRPKSITSSSNAPVVFWIYGGGNLMGYNYMYPNLSHVAHSLGAIVVAPNYRVGALGNLALPSLSAASPTGTSGNYGITDLRAALVWVRQHISAWGGDPHGVTLMGQSSGGTNILALLANSSDDGQQRRLFRAAISLSASPNITASLSHAEAFNVEHALAHSPCAPPTYANDEQQLACLYNLSSVEANALFTSDYALDTNLCRYQQGCEYPPFPFVDGVTLKKPLPQALRDAQWDGIDTILLQSTAQEAAAWMLPQALQGVSSASEYRAFLANHTAALGYPPTFATAIEAVYGPFDAPYDAPYFTMLADMSVSFGQTELANAILEGSNGPTVLVGYVVCRPGMPFPLGPGDYATNLSFHNWDFTAASGAWEAYTEAPAFASQQYTPTTSDVAFQQQLIAQWHAIVHASNTPPWKPYAQDGGIGVVDCRETTSGVNRTIIQNGLEDALDSRPLEEYWWTG